MSINAPQDPSRRAAIKKIGAGILTYPAIVTSIFTALGCNTTDSEIIELETIPFDDFVNQHLEGKLEFDSYEELQNKLKALYEDEKFRRICQPLLMKLKKTPEMMELIGLNPYPQTLIQYFLVARYGYAPIENKLLPVKHRVRKKINTDRKSFLREIRVDYSFDYVFAAELEANQQNNETFQGYTNFAMPYINPSAIDYTQKNIFGEDGADVQIAQLSTMHNESAHAILNYFLNKKKISKDNVSVDYTTTKQETIILDYTSLVELTSRYAGLCVELQKNIFQRIVLAQDDSKLDGYTIADKVYRDVLYQCVPDDQHGDLDSIYLLVESQRVDWLNNKNLRINSEKFKEKLHGFLVTAWKDVLKN